MTRNLENLCLVLGTVVVACASIWGILDYSQVIKTMFIYKSKGFMYAMCLMGGSGLALLPSIIRDLKEAIKDAKKA